MVTRRFAIVGTGRMAATMMPVLKSAGVRVDAVVSKSQQRAASFAQAFDIASGTADLSEVLARSDIDAVYVANMPNEHAATVVAALQAGKAVLCEKPIATSRAELEGILRAAERSDKLCMEGLWTLCLPAYRSFLDDAHQKQFGEPQSLVASFAYPLRDIDTTMEAAQRSGVLLDRGIYLIALALVTLGAVSEINAKITVDPLGIDIDAFLLLEHESGAHSQLATSFTSLMSNTATLNCSRGLIEIQEPLIGAESITRRTYAPRAAPQSSTTPAPYTPGLKGWLRQRPHIRSLKRFFDRPASRRASYGGSEYLPQLEHFLALLNAGRSQSDIVPLSLSSAVMTIIDQVKQAHHVSGS